MLVRADGGRLEHPPIMLLNLLDRYPLLDKVHNVYLYYYNIMFNPLCYDGSTYRQIEENWKFNELGFMIVFTFTGLALWSFLWAQRQNIRNFKKRFVYQEYQKRKFL